MKSIKNNRGMEKLNLILFVSAILILAIAGLAAAFKGYIIKDVRETKPSNQAADENAGKDGQLIGGDKDEGGCLIAAGYSWCEIKNKCLRTWEEPCIEEEIQSLVEGYIEKNISALSPEKEVLGGKFYVTRFSFTDDNRVVVDYEDGHIAIQAAAIFSIIEGTVLIDDFTILDDKGFNNENKGGLDDF